MFRYMYDIIIADFKASTNFWTGGVEVEPNGPWVWNQTQVNILPSLWASSQPDDRSGPNVLDYVSVFFRSSFGEVRLYAADSATNRKSLCKYTTSN